MFGQGPVHACLEIPSQLGSPASQAPIRLDRYSLEVSIQISPSIPMECRLALATYAMEGRCPVMHLPRVFHSPGPPVSVPSVPPPKEENLEWCGPI